MKGCKGKLSFVDLFAGCGGLSLGLLKAGMKGVFAIEKDPGAFETLSSNLNNDNAGGVCFDWPHWLPVAPISIDEVLKKYDKELNNIKGRIDVVAGGPPCQGFSAAGKRQFEDPRNSLIKSYLKFVNIVSPKYVLVENVAGIEADFVNSDGVRVNYADYLVAALGEEYSVYRKKILMSQYGVPQSRVRVIFIAVRKDLKISKDPFDFLDDTKGYFERGVEGFSSTVNSYQAISDLEINKNGLFKSFDYPNFDFIDYKKPKSNYQKMMNSGSDGRLSDTRVPRHREEIIERFAKLIEICHEEGRLNISIGKDIRDRFGLKKMAIRVLDPRKPSPTITSMPDDLIHYSEPRILTVRENARLQSFPDWFQFRGKYTSGGLRRKNEVPRYTQVANAVPPLFAEILGISILEMNNAIQEQGLGSAA